jgi:MFS family permease
MALAQSLWVFVVGLVLYNLTGFVTTPMSSYVADMRGRWKVGRALTLTQAMYNLGAVAGPVLGGWIGHQLGLRSVYQFSFWVFVLSVLLIFLIRPQPKVEHAHPGPVVKLHQSPRFLILLCFFFLTTFSTYLPQPLTPNYLQNQQGLDLAQIGQLGSIGSMGVVVFMLVLGNLSPVVGLLVGQSAMALYAFLLWRGRGFEWFALAYSCMGGYRLARVMILAYARPVVPQTQISFAFGMIELVNGLALFLAPPVGAWLYAQSPAALYSVGLFGVIVVALINLTLLPVARRSFETSQIPSFSVEELKQ